ncbi:hypothetical protein FRC03_001752 [Tulasnella sp. 419]|nr:hypothetical protein FRC02_006992 [Tulasnella sp. 418]KAG8945274.1 hypothetical protein FRC03_001752 [Tulasnella sp. 419]
MRGEYCVAAATFFSFTSLLLLIFAHVGQIDTSNVPRNVNMVSMNVSGYGQALYAATGSNAPGLYVENATLPLNHSMGLRQNYAWGLYGHCGYIDVDSRKQGLCSNSSFAYRFVPFDVMLGDVPEQYYIQTRTLVPNVTKFKDSGFLGGLTGPAFYLLFIGTLATFAAVVTGVIRHKYTFTAAAFFSIIATLFILIGASIWTSAINSAKSVNMVVVRGGVSLGVTINAGSALWLFWAAFVLLLMSILPYVISCWSYIKR